MSADEENFQKFTETRGSMAASIAESKKSTIVRKSQGVNNSNSLVHDYVPAYD